jgi:beta-glucosidase
MKNQQIVRQSAYDPWCLSYHKKQGDVLTVSFDLTNTGKYDATEVAQLYVQDRFGSVTRPVKELKRFERIALKSGESRSVSFSLPIEELAFWNIDMKKVVEAGDFNLWVGGDSRAALKGSFVVE